MEMIIFLALSKNVPRQKQKTHSAGEWAENFSADFA